MESAFRDSLVGSNSATVSPSDLPNRVPYPRALLKRVLTLGPYGPGARVLDVGCGLGHFAQYLGSLGLDVTGLDGSESNIESARLLNPNIDFHVGFVPREHFLAHNPNFDLIFARSLGATADGSWSRSTLLTISALMACLRSDGLLVVELDSDKNSTHNRKALTARIIELAKSTGPIRHELMRVDAVAYVILRYECSVTAKYSG